MNLPESLREAINKEISRYSLKDLSAATEDLSFRYRSRDRKTQSHYMNSDLHRAAYINMRMPATYAAVHFVLSEIKKHCPDFQPGSLLDLGAGPGTAMWATDDTFDVQTIDLLEQDRDLIALGKRLAEENTSFKNANWLQQNLNQGEISNSYDLVTASYALGELDKADMKKVFRTAWEKTNGIMVVIEPGTPKGYQDILLIRDELIALGAHIIAPCPHALTCSMIADPLTPNDWCHFGVRLSRSSQHRHVKGGELSYEDEKFSYIVAGKFPGQSFDARIVHRPLHKSGHTILDLCVKEQKIVRQTISRKDKDLYRQAKKADWAEVW